MLDALPLVFVLIGGALYVALGGADLGAGLWQLAGGRDSEVRDFAHAAMAPVWEANHVWLIFVLTVFWTAYPSAFGSIASTLAVPFFIALLGLVFRGAAYALRGGALTPRESGRIDTTFAFSSILVPFALGAALGGIATDRVPVGNAAGSLWSSWLNITSIFIGFIAVVFCAYLAAVYLAADAARDGKQSLEREFRRRSLGAGLVAGGLAIVGIVVVDLDSHQLFHSLTSGSTLPAVITSGLAGAGTLVLVFRRCYEPARYCAGLAVSAVIAGWALARWPEILPSLSIHRAAASHDTLVCLVVAVLAGGVIVFPALAVLFRLTLTGRFRASELELRETRSSGTGTSVFGSLLRVAIACLVAGFGLLTIANAPWMHGVGVTCLISFVVLAFVAIATAGLSDAAETEDFERAA
jgi:cytochrome bd ubiquinol oxidase subunit II